MKNKLDFLTTIAYWGIIFGLIWLVLRFVVPPALPFLLGFSVASAFHPIVSRISKTKKRWFATGIIIIPFWGVLLFFLWKVGALIYGEAAELLRWIQTTDFKSLLSSLNLPFLNEDIAEWFFQQADSFLPTIINLSQKALMKLLNLLLALPNALIFSFAMVASSVLFSVSYPNIEPFVLRQMPARWQAEYFDVKDFFVRKIIRFLKADFIMFLINYGELTIGLYLLQSPYPLIFAALVSLADLLPYVGMASILIPWGLIQWLVLSNPSQGIGLIVLAVIVTLVRQLLEPRIVGKTIGLSALATLISIYFGMRWMGVVGVFLFPLLFLFIKEWNDSGRLFLWKNKPD